MQIYTTFSQIAGSAVRLLTNIPHCCTVRIGVFSDPMWSIDLPVTTTGFPLVKKLPLTTTFPRSPPS